MVPFLYAAWSFLDVNLNILLVDLSVDGSMVSRLSGWSTYGDEIGTCPTSVLRFLLNMGNLHDVSDFIFIGRPRCHDEMANVSELSSIPETKGRYFDVKNDPHVCRCYMVRLLGKVLRCEGSGYLMSRPDAAPFVIRVMGATGVRLSAFMHAFLSNVVNPHS
uniref:SOCS box domain-containing protein n=1 Tax=Ascaris lumbricoides TaxID=6252 RepID=A0A0M3HVZ9_ASCLU